MSYILYLSKKQGHNCHKERYIFFALFWFFPSSVHVETESDFLKK